MPLHQHKQFLEMKDRVEHNKESNTQPLFFTQTRNSPTDSELRHFNPREMMRFSQKSPYDAVGKGEPSAKTANSIIFHIAVLRNLMTFMT